MWSQQKHDRLLFRLAFFPTPKVTQRYSGVVVFFFVLMDVFVCVCVNRNVQLISSGEATALNCRVSSINRLDRDSS